MNAVEFVTKDGPELAEFDSPRAAALFYGVLLGLTSRPMKLIVWGQVKEQRGWIQ